MEDVTHKVASQYTAYPYPKPAEDLVAYTQAAIELFDPSFFGPKFWPEGQARADLDILVAGCGTQQAAVIAYRNPGCRVVGVDISEASLGHERYLRDRHKLDNLELALGDLREVGKLGRSFDLIISSGVLHHMADPSEGLSALREVLRPEGAMGLMVYAPLGRSGLYPLQDAFRRMRLEQTPEGIAVVRATLAALPQIHPVQPYLKYVDELKTDEGLVDSFLHPQDRAYSVPEVLDWVVANGLEFQGWSDNHLYYPQAMIGGPSFFAIAGLPEVDQWAVCEALLPQGKHSFFVRHPGRAKRPDFSGADWLGYKPSFPPNVRVYDRGRQEDGTVTLYDLKFAVTPAEVEALTGVDGLTTIEAIMDRPVFGRVDRAQRETFARNLFERLWKAGALMMTVG